MRDDKCADPSPRFRSPGVVELCLLSGLLLLGEDAIDTIDERHVKMLIVSMRHEAINLVES